MKSLIFSPHPDDETLSCGGYILKELSKGSQVKVVLLTAGATGARKGLNVDDKEFFEIRCHDFETAVKKLGVENYEIYGWGNDFFKDNETSVIEKIINSIKTFKPEIVMCPQPEDTHRVHRATYIAVKESLYHCVTGAYNSHSEGALPKMNLFFYESPESDMDSNATHVCDISDFFGKKMEIFEQSYPNQAVEPFVSWPRTRAEHWGLKAGVKYGEAFKPAAIAKYLIV